MQFPTDVEAQPLERLAAPFDHNEWTFEPKIDGFRGLAYLAQGQGLLVSRYGRPFARFTSLAAELAGMFRRHAVILDGEVACVDENGAVDFRRLLTRRATPDYFAFDVLWLDGEDLRALPLAERKRHLRRLIGRARPPLRIVPSIIGRGCDLFATACAHDLEGIVAKWRQAPYGLVGGRSSWVKVKHAGYSQARHRGEGFASRG